MIKRGFTLIEMIIVLLIIAILLSLSIGLSGRRVSELKRKTVQEQFVYNYNNLFSKNMLTNYYSGEHYGELVVKFSVGDDKFGYFYDNFPNSINYISTKDGLYKIDQLLLDENSKESVDVKFSPYVLGCSIFDGQNNQTGKILDIYLSINSEKYCFKINYSLCRLEKMDCDEKN